jgi:hypothetical protein
MDALATTVDELTQVRDRPFDPYRIPKTDGARALVADVLNQLQNYEQHLRKRQRQRRPRDQEVFEQTVSAIVSDVAHRWLTAPAGRVSVPFSKQVLGRRGRYRSPVLGKTLPTVVERLASPEMSFVELELGYANPFEREKGRQTTVWAGERLIRRIGERNLSLDDFGVTRSQEFIILKRSKEGAFDKGKLIDYEDTVETHRRREEMRRINDWLEAADLDVDPASEPVDLSNRLLRRYFNNSSFGEGGRLFGGFWQDLSKRRRREELWVEGDRAVTLDYAQMGPKILYSLARAAPPAGDAYSVPGWTGHRAGIKKIFNALLFSDKLPVRFPVDTRNLFPRRASVVDVVDVILKHHDPVRHLFCTDVGFKVFYVESEILVGVLLELIGLGIVALPVHDAVVVAEKDQEEVRDVMLQTFRHHTGIDGEVDIDE